MINVCDLIEKIELIAPFDTQCEYDNSGLQIGSAEHEVKKLGICLDINMDILKAANASGITTILTHHPLLFRPVKALTDADYRYDMITYCIKNDIDVISCHTNFDRCPLSNSVTLLKRMGLSNVELYDSHDASAIGEFQPAITVEELRRRLDAMKLRFPYVLHVFGASSMSTAYCIAGAGGGSEENVYKADLNSDLFVSSEFKHSNLEMARALGVNVIELSHYDSEVTFEQTMREYLLNYFKAAFPIYILTDK